MSEDNTNESRLKYSVYSVPSKLNAQGANVW